MFARTARNTALRRGLTLLEVIIAVAIMAILLGMMATFFWQTLRVRGIVEDEVDRTAVARMVLGRMSEELRGVLGAEQIRFPQGQQRLVGDRRSITFLTTTLPRERDYGFRDEFEPPPPGAHDIRMLSYRLDYRDDQQDPNGDPLNFGILRTEMDTLGQTVVEEEDPLAVRDTPWAPEIKYLEYRYFDGVEWTTTWDLTAGNSLPQMIQITLAYEPISFDEWEDRDLDEWPLEEYPLGPDVPQDERYSMIVRLPAADRFYGSRMQRMGQQLSEQFAPGLSP